MSTLAAAGANNPSQDLAGILTSAVSEGFSSSKAVDMLIQNTAAMAQQSSMAAGINSMAEISSALTAAASASGNPNREFALQRAATAMDVVNQSASNINVDFQGLMNTARVQQATGLDDISATAAGAMTIADIRSLQGDPEARKKLISKGIYLEEGADVSKFLGTMLDTKAAAFSDKFIGTTTNEQRDQITNAIKTGDASKLDDKTRARIAAISNLQDGATDKELLDAASAMLNSRPEKNKSAGSLPGAGKSFEDADLLATSGFKQLSEAAKNATTQLGGFSTAIEKFVALQQGLEKDGAKKEEDFSKLAEIMANDMKVKVVEPFGEQVKQFGIHIDKLKSGIPLVPTKIEKPLKEATNVFSKIKSRYIN